MFVETVTENEEVRSPQWDFVGVYFAKSLGQAPPLQPLVGDGDHLGP